jgi:ribosomal protein S3
MSQKINPIALRLKVNRQQDFSWFSNYNYTSILIKEMLIRNYLKKTFQQPNFYASRIYIKITSKRAKLYPFFKQTNLFSTKRNTKEKLNYQLTGYKKTIRNIFLKTKHNTNISNRVAKACSFTDTLKFVFLLWKYKRIQKNQYATLLGSLLIFSNSLDALLLFKNNILTFNRSIAFLEQIITKKQNVIVDLLPLKVLNDLKSSEWIAQYIAANLVVNQSYRLCLSHILKKLNRFYFARGIRILCSGTNINILPKKLGQSPLNKYIAKIDYSNVAAYTKLGKIGIKVFICYI